MKSESIQLLDSLSVRGMEMMTPFPVPIHRRLHDTNRAVILTNEKPSFPVPNKKEHVEGQIWVILWQVLWYLKESRTDPAFCWRRARCRRPGGAGRCERGTAWEWSQVWWTPRSRRHPRPADVPGCPSEGEHQMTSAKVERISADATDGSSIKS